MRVKEPQSGGAVQRQCVGWRPSFHLLKMSLRIAYIIHHQHKYYYVLLEDNTATCFDRYVDVFGPFKYIKLKLQLQVHCRVGRLRYQALDVAIEG